VKGKAVEYPQDASGKCLSWIALCSLSIYFFRSHSIIVHLVVFCVSSHVVTQGVCTFFEMPAADLQQLSISQYLLIYGRHFGFPLPKYEFS